jgi:alkylhydroperoxidase/carboxymuconolactone decarboxylase family protein YurZ
VAHAGADVSVIDDIKKGLIQTKVSDKLRALLNIALHIREGGKRATEEDIRLARENGATDKEMHDTVLIAAAFCVYNRYVDGLATWAPPKNEEYLEMGRNIAEHG